MALLGALMGFARWSKHHTSGHLLAYFMLLSGACGVGQVALLKLGYGTAWFGNLWELAVVGILIPSCAATMRVRSRSALAPLKWAVLFVWAVDYLVFGGMSAFNYHFPILAFGLLGLYGAFLLSQYVDDSVGLLHKQGFILGVVAISASMTDVLTSFALAHYASLTRAFIIYMMSARNLIWCGIYAMLAYSFTLDSRNRRDACGWNSTENQQDPKQPSGNFSWMRPLSATRLKM